MLSKLVEVDQIEILKIGVVQVRVATVISEDGVVLSKAYHRHCVIPGEDYSTQDKKVQDICAVVHTPEMVLAYQETLSTHER